jgi:ribonuclease PH
MRPLSLRVGINGQAAGSAFLELGSTKVCATVYGPRENAHAGTDGVSSGVLECRAQFAPFASRARRSLTSSAVFEQERCLEALLHQALLPCLLLERCPKSVVEVHVLVLEEDGGELAASILAASAALIDAGIDVLDVVSAAQVCMLPLPPSSSSSSSGSAAPAPAPAPAAPAAAAAAAACDPAALLCTLDPSSAEASQAQGFTTVAYMPCRQQLTLVSHSGELSAEAVVQSLALALQGAAAADQQVVRAVLRSAAEARLASLPASAPSAAEPGQQLTAAAASMACEA